VVAGHGILNISPVRHFKHINVSTEPEMSGSGSGIASRRQTRLAPYPRNMAHSTVGGQSNLP
jgi:hypothetical protein